MYLHSLNWIKDVFKTQNIRDYFQAPMLHSPLPFPSIPT